MKVNEIQALMRDKKLDALLVTDRYNMRYLSGCTADTGCLYISENRWVFLTDSRYTTQAKAECGERFQVLEVTADCGYAGHLRELTGIDQVGTIGYEDQVMTCAEAAHYQQETADLTWIPTGDMLNRLRYVKSEEEILLIEQAERIGDKAFDHILGVIRPGMTELEVAAEIEYVMKRQGAERLSFDTIAASGIHSAMPHAVPTDKKLENGDFLTMDFGCVYHGYCSDMTRTVVIGKATEKQKEIYHIVLEAQMAALDTVHAGMRGSKVDGIAREIIAQAGYGECFGHGLGHSLGLYIHENPRLSMMDDTILEEHMVETVEPGIYVPGFGGVRIEDVVVVERNGCRNLTHSPKELIEI